MCLSKKSFVFRLFIPLKMRRGLIAFHLAYVQVARVPPMEAVVSHIIWNVLQTCTRVVIQGAIQDSKNVADT